MGYGIGQAHKLGKKNRKRLDNITDPSSAPSTLSYSYEKLNKTLMSQIKIINCKYKF